MEFNYIQDNPWFKIQNINIHAQNRIYDPEAEI